MVLGGRSPVCGKTTPTTTMTTTTTTTTTQQHTHPVPSRERVGRPVMERGRRTVPGRSSEGGDTPLVRCAAELQQLTAEIS